jgi:hypothetical protein
VKKFKMKWVVISTAAALSTAVGMARNPSRIRDAASQQLELSVHVVNSPTDIAWQDQSCRSREPYERAFFEARLKRVEPEVASSLSRHFLWLCKKYRFDPLFVASLIHVESRFDPSIVSYRGAVGLMQVMPTTAAYLMEQDGAEADLAALQARLSDPFFNLTVGIRYLAQLRDRYEGQARYFLAAYHGGPGRVDEVLQGKRRPLTASLDYVRSIRIGLGLMRLEIPRSCKETKIAAVKSKTI